MPLQQSTCCNYAASELPASYILGAGGRACSCRGGGVRKKQKKICRVNGQGNMEEVRFRRFTAFCYYYHRSCLQLISDSGVS